MTHPPANPASEVARYGAGHFKFAAPGDRQHDMWILRFDDAERREMSWSGNIYADPEGEAWAAWNRYSPSWNCRVFRTAHLLTQAQAPALTCNDSVQVVGAGQEEINDVT